MPPQKLLQELRDVRRRDLAAQMGQMFGAQQARIGGAPHGFGEFEHGFAEFGASFVLVRADAEGIEHRRDAGRGDLRVIGEHGAAGVPDHGGTRHEMRLQMIGVHFDEAGQQIVAAEIDAAFRAGARTDLDDASLFDARKTLDHLGRRNNSGVGDGERAAFQKFHRLLSSVFAQERFGGKRAKVGQGDAQRLVRPVPPGEPVHPLADLLRKPAAQHPRRHADDDRIGFDVTRDNRAGADDRAVAT